MAVVVAQWLPGDRGRGPQAFRRKSHEVRLLGVGVVRFSDRLAMDRA